MQCKFSLVKNPIFRSSKCQGCEKQTKTKGKRPEGIVFTNADSLYATKLNDPQGGDTTMLMQQVREVMTVNQEMTDKSGWIWLTSEQTGFPLRSECVNENHGEAGSSKNVIISVLIRPHFFGACHHRFHSKHKKGTL